MCAAINLSDLDMVQSKKHLAAAVNRSQLLDKDRMI
jgi:hypothetical protein